MRRNRSASRQRAAVVAKKTARRAPVSMSPSPSPRIANCCTTSNTKPTPSHRRSRVRETPGSDGVSEVEPGVTRLTRTGTARRQRWQRRQGRQGRQRTKGNESSRQFLSGRDRRERTPAILTILSRASHRGACFLQMHWKISDGGREKRSEKGEKDCRLPCPPGAPHHWGLALCPRTGNSHRGLRPPTPPTPRQLSAAAVRSAPAGARRAPRCAAA